MQGSEGRQREGRAARPSVEPFDISTVTDSYSSVTLEKHKKKPANLYNVVLAQNNCSLFSKKSRVRKKSRVVVPRSFDHT